MKKINGMNAYTFDEILNQDLGAAGTPVRDDFEAHVQADVQAYNIGEAIKKARLAQKMTQEQLGERLGVQRSQISRIENGRKISISTLGRVFKALGIATATLDLGAVGKIILW